MPHEYGNSDDRQLSARSYANIQLLTLQTQYLQKKTRLLNMLIVLKNN